MIQRILLAFLFIIPFSYLPIHAEESENQTATVSPIYPGDELPFKITIGDPSFVLPSGIQSYVFGVYKGKWLLLTGRINGLHGFDSGDDNFPPNQQNTNVYVIDPQKKKVYVKSLTDPSSGLSQQQVDLLSVTSAQGYQSKNTLYVTGGYGVDQATGLFSTKDALSAINIPGLIHWVTRPSKGETAAQHIRQIFNPIFQVTGGYMTKIGKNPTLLVFGQNFQGFYHSESNGIYTEQVRRFEILDDGYFLGVKIKKSSPTIPDPNYRRRDLNVVPIVKSAWRGVSEGLVAFSGVFTEAGGIWTVPVTISAKGVPFMEDPTLAQTFKQGMNNYASPTIGLYSKNSKNMYVVILGGISFGFFNNGTFQTDPEIPFINQVTTIRINNKGHFKQFLMDAEYPTIISTSSNAGNPLLFGAGAEFIPSDEIKSYRNGVLKLDNLGRKPIVIGYIVGGIQSTLPNTNTMSDSAASPYVFPVILSRGDASSSS